MKTIKAKLTALLMAVGCFLACFGVGVVTLDTLQQTNVTASAETVRTITKAGATGSSSATAIYVYALEGDATGSGNWSDKFFFVADSGKGIKFNDVTLDGYEMKQPGNDIYLGLVGKSAVAGDEVTLDGTFYCEKLDSKIVFKNCGLRYNGSTWDSFTPPTVHNIGALVLHGNSVTGGAKGDNTVLYLQRADGGALPILTWDHAFTYESGSGFKVNGVQKTPATIKSTGDGFYWQFDALAAGDSVLIGGTFYCESQNVKYVIEESIFQWTGASWIKFAEYEKFNVGELTYSHGNAQHVYLKPVDESVTLPINSWGDAFSYVSGNGITVDGAMISMINSVKSPDGAFFVDLGSAANTDAILKIEGTFRCAAYELDYVIKESTFQWNGSTWVPYIEYEEYNLGKMSLNWPSEKAENAKNNQLYLNQESGDVLPIPDETWKTVFTLGSGDGLKVNGVVKSIAEIKSTELGLFLLFDGVGIGDVATVSGTFICPEKATRYTVEESAFQWNGTVWVPYVEYKAYNVGKVTIGANSNASAVYFANANGNHLEVSTGWDEKFTFVEGSGIGVTLNGEQINMNDIKVPGTMYVGLGTTAKTGDVLAIGGTFCNETNHIKYTITESVFQLNGSTWVPYVEYKTYNVGKVTIGANSNASAVYFANANGNNLEVPTGWDETFTFVEGSGIGVTLNGEQINMNDIKVPGTMYVGLGTTAKTGDVLAIGGTFCNETNHIKYTITESVFQLNGSTWVPYVEYKTYNVGKVTIAADSNASAVHFANANGNNLEVSTGWHETFTFVEGSGIGVTLNGEQINMNDIKVPGTMYVGLGTTAKTGDVLAIGGTFYNETYTVKYVIEVSEFVWSGAAWIVDYSNLSYEEYDTITIFDLGLGVEKTVEGSNYSGLAYMPSEENTTGSVVFRFGYNSVNTAAGELALRFRGSAWNGIRFQIVGGKLQSLFGANTSVALENNTDYVIELGLIDTADGNSIWGYAKVNGIMHISELINKSDVNVYGEQGTELFGSYTTSHVSIYAATNTTFTDPHHIMVTYVTYNASTDEDIEYTEYAKKGHDYTLTGQKTYQTFIGWVDENGALYDAGQTISIADDVESLCFTSAHIDFAMDDGAAIRIAGTAGTSGIRFTTRIWADEINYLYSLVGVVDISFGTLIMPYDYLKTTGQKPNLTDFKAYDGTENIIGKTILKLVSSEEKRETIDGYIVYRGAMQNIQDKNYGRLFAGRGYMEITFDDGTVKTVYTPFEIEDHVRSVRNVAQKFQADDSVAENGTLRYEGLSDTLKGIVDEYAASGAINLMDYDAYKVNTFLNVIAWYYPELDPTNGYNNDHNKEIAEKMKAAGIRAIYLDGKYHLDLDTIKNIEKTRQIIKYFWDKHGLYTIAFGSNASNNFYLDYSAVDFPDFSDCEGFIGFLVWDEPESERMDTLAEFVNNFEKVYAGSNATFMVNLLPSYASVFNSGSTSWLDSQIDKLDKNAYKNYLANYCKDVLGQLDGGEKWLSLDSYPIKADKSLSPYFLFDLAMLKTTALVHDAHSHIALQACGWKEGTSTTMYRMPTEAEMRMQAYAAMAFGIDSISWWSYGDMRDEEQYNPTDNSDYYTRFANVNNELAAIGHIYKAFEWKGVILGAGKDNPTWNSATKTYVDDDYEACNAVKGQIGDYELSASDTKHLSKVATNKTNWNYLLGVMEDMNGNEGYVLCNYNNQSSDRAQTITLTFASNVTQAIIYRGGDPQTVTVSSKTLTISLATGEGVIVLPSKLG